MAISTIMSPSAPVSSDSKTKEERGCEKGVNPPFSSFWLISVLWPWEAREFFQRAGRGKNLGILRKQEKCEATSLRRELGEDQIARDSWFGLVFSFYSIILPTWVVNIQHKLWPQKSVNTSWKWPRYSSTSSSKYTCWYVKRKCQPQFIAEGLVPRWWCYFGRF